jgi:hypothetical protein
MTPDIELDPGFVFEGIPPIEDAMLAAAAPADPLGPLAPLPGTWKGTGFNAIWRPHHPSSPQDRFLELNLTNETIVFTKISGPIPNRGLLMPDINMFGVSYVQQISEANNGPALHFEPGIWVNVPPTSNPSEPPTVVRMASIPHGTVILAQGTADFHPGGPPAIPNNNIIPFQVGGPQVSFPELILSTPTQFRHATQGVTQAMVDNPNSVLQAVVQGKPMTSRMHIHVTTQHTPIKGGGVANTAFLAAASNPPGGNANAAQVDATFWIETLPGSGGGPDILQLQYTQLVGLDFNGLRWPHVTVATLRKQ